MKNDDVELNCLDLPLEWIAHGGGEISHPPGLHSHLEECRDCQERLRVMLGLQLLLQNRPAEPHFGAIAVLRRPVAAVLALALVASATIFLFISTSSVKELASSAPHPLFLLDTRAPARESAPPGAFADYQRGRYPEAAAALARFPADPEASLYRGVCLYLLGQLEEAAQILLPLTVDGLEQRDNAFWFLGQVRLRQRRTSEARAALSEIAPQNRYFEAARHQIRQLDQRSAP